MTGPAPTLPPPAVDGDAAAEIVVLIGNPRPGSRTRTLAEAAARVLTAQLARAATQLRGVRVLELAEIVGVTFGPDPAYGATPGVDPFEAVRSARLLIVATPTYKGSYTGLLKIFLDQFGPGALAGAVAVPVAVAASEPHLRAVTVALGDLLAELGAGLPAEPLALLEGQLGDLDEVVGDWAGRQVGLIGGELAGRLARR